MKATLEFNLPDEQYEYESAVHGQAYRSILLGIDNHLRDIAKHGDNDARAEFAAEIRRRIYECLDGEGVDLL